MAPGPARSTLKEYFPGRLRLNYHLIPVPDHRLLYVKNPKAGCSTVLLWLDRLHTGELDFAPSNVHAEHRLPRPAELGWPEVRDMLGGSAYRFSFVRDPLRRLESAYRDKIVRGGDRWREEVLTTLGDAADAGVELTFDRFLSALEQQEPLTMNPHWRPQHLNLMHPVVHYDHVGRLETFDSDLARIREEARLPEVPLQVRNASRRPDRESVYDGRPDLVRRAEAIYAQDYEIYGY
jgi:hypothetical protein